MKSDSPTPSTVTPSAPTVGQELAQSPPDATPVTAPVSSEVVPPAAPSTPSVVTTSATNTPLALFSGAEGVPANWTIAATADGIEATCTSGAVFVGGPKEFSAKFGR